MEHFVINALYVFAFILMLGFGLVIIYGLIELINYFIEEYRDGMYWFSPKK